MSFDDLEIGEIAMDLDDQEPEDVIEWAFDALGDRVEVVTVLQIDGMVVLDMATKIRPDVRVITVDTGRLPQETYAFIEQVRERYPQILEPEGPRVQSVQTAVDRGRVNQVPTLRRTRKDRVLYQAPGLGVIFHQPGAVVLPGDEQQFSTIPGVHVAEYLFGVARDVGVTFLGGDPCLG
ncbi:phosphoadenosine phosphosulfate reductase domain-containing protein [Sphaerimonospora thailandensis]|uniref:Phosphoadenosine phosphosulphate reductase domain-containing protein n=1 Tax=Sphaerimonospora thailandensis TaxID=795644 RepID=A0A8J3VY24_9ACTN|nr:phosphoadenosine phosphosulfate reductase family protein [Sphaerimonospora thailandensis]GIH69529.1 hypothetical protein Mth01_17820 [Sphaerimonospora thailandensis]